MAQALYRKYRSKSLSEIIGQEHITDTLQKALETGRISHAYLFTGPRGVGKTSIARILAHEINGLPYTDDSMHMDIIEIDAASNRRIDEIRELRDKVYVAPTSAKYKVYIIDEVHMLTREAFNALLKTLEEPPAHVVFILATTDAHKLPDTIVSRTQRYSFKPVETAKVVAHLRSIAEAENITVSDEALELLAVHGEGSFRDSIGMLDQAGNMNGEIALTDVRQLLGMPPLAAIEELLQTLTNASPPAILMQQLVQLYEQGYTASMIAKQLAQQLRLQLVHGTLRLKYELALNILERLLTVPLAQDSDRLLEIVLLETLPAQDVVPNHALKTVLAPTVPAADSKESVMPRIEAKKAILADLIVEDVPALQAETNEKAELEPHTRTSATELNNDSWQAVLNALKKQHNTLYGLVRMAEPDFSHQGTIGLCFAFEFHRKRLMDTKNQQKLQDVIKSITGNNLKIECTVDKKTVATTPTLPPLQPADETLANISNIFGGGELVE